MINPKAVPLVEEEFVESSDPTILVARTPRSPPRTPTLWRKYWQEVRAG